MSSQLTYINEVRVKVIYSVCLERLVTAASLAREIHKQNLFCMCLFGFQRGEDRECRFSSHDLHLLPFWERRLFNLPAQSYTTLNVSWSALARRTLSLKSVNPKSLSYFLFVTRRLPAYTHHCRLIADCEIMRT
jgi:hypothetical protein